MSRRKHRRKFCHFECGNKFLETPVKTQRWTSSKFKTAFQRIKVKP